MKLVNPVGRKPMEKGDFRSYRACACVGQKLASDSYGYDSCTRCACTCNGTNAKGDAQNAADSSDS